MGIKLLKERVPKSYHISFHEKGHATICVSAFLKCYGYFSFLKYHIISFRLDETDNTFLILDMKKLLIRAVEK